MLIDYHTKVITKNHILYLNIENQLHRLDGPASIWLTTGKEYYAINNIVYMWFNNIKNNIELFNDAIIFDVNYSKFIENNIKQLLLNNNAIINLLYFGKEDINRLSSELKNLIMF